MKIKTCSLYILFFFTILTFTASFAWAESITDEWNPKWSDYLITLLPSPIEKIKLKQSHVKDVEKLLGKAALVKSNKHYFEINHFKYDLEIIYNRDIVTEISFTFNSQHPPLGDIHIPFKLLIPYSSFKKTADKKTATTDGRYFVYSDKSKDLVIDIVDKTISSVRFK